MPLHSSRDGLGRLLIARARHVVAYRVRCSCGYSSGEHERRLDAVDDWAMHVARAGELERELGELGELEGD